MKKIIFIITLLIFLVPLNIYATNDTKIVCDKNKLAVNEIVTCKIVAQNLNFAATDITANISFSDNVTLVESSYNKDIWLSLDSNFSVLDINLMRNSNTQVSSLEVATFKIRAKKDATGMVNIKFDNISMGNSEYKSVKLNSSNITLNIKSANNDLKYLTVNGKNLDVNLLVNNVNIDSETVDIKASVVDSNAKIEGLGVYKLKYGKNLFYINVISESGISKKYTLTITRKDNRNGNNYLQSLKISPGNIQFEKNKMEYTVEVDGNVESINVIATLENELSTFVAGYEPRKVNLKHGLNEIYIKVKSENEEERTYKLNITRKDDRSNNNYVKDIILSYGNIKFEKNKLDYTITVPYSIDNIDVEVKLDDLKSKKEIIKNDKLEVGRNVILIRVIAENTEIREYKIEIIRNEETKLINLVKQISIKNHEIIFNPNVYEYYIKTAEDKLEINVVLNSEKAKYRIDGNNNLKDGSVIYIIVEDEYHMEYTYKLNVLKSNVDNNSNSILIIVLLILSLLANIILIIIMIKRKSKLN